MNCRIVISVLLILVACDYDRRKEEISATLDVNGFILDRSIDAQLDSILPGINCVITESGYQFYIIDSISATKEKQMIVVPFLSRSNSSSTGFSLLENKLVFISPEIVREFVSTHSFSDSTDIRGYLAMVLLHEWAHIYMNLPSVIDLPKTHSALGEQNMPELTPQELNEFKRNELRMDSTAVAWVKNAVKSTKPRCFDTAFNIQFATNAGEFIDFGERMINSFGDDRGKVLIDHSNSHPNFELLLAFMNYYFNPNPEKREMIDQYLYDRVEGAVYRQEIDLRINQSMEKILDSIP